MPYDQDRMVNHWIESLTGDDLVELEALQNDPEQLKDAFYQELSFGTAGLRGVLGVGTNRMNVYTVGRATQGLASYLKKTYENPAVAICRDSRHGSDLFARDAACVLAANGVRAYVYPRIEPTPALSFAVRDLGCSAGINITASHNPAQYNGYKAYGPDGCQITSEAAAAISQAIDEVDYFSVARMDYDQAVDEGLIAPIGEDTLDRFMAATEAQLLGGTDGDLKLVYTPLNGTGLECVTRILTRIGVTDVHVVPEQRDPDGDFPTCPYPNPEIREALERGIELCEQVHPDLLLATDPDADRVGTAVKDGDDYSLISGNEMGVLLLDFIARMRAERGEDLTRAVAITTIVSSAMVDALAAEYGFELRRVLTGFKYIGEQIGRLEADGEAERFIFGFEESYGYLAGSHVRDKDAVVASMLICQMARWYRAQGMNLADGLRALYAKHGFYRNKTISVAYPGADGAERMRSIMDGLHGNPPAQVAGREVRQVLDYSHAVDMPVVNLRGGDTRQKLPAANVVELQLGQGCKVIVRPSGTEPKIKAYVFSRGASEEEADELLALFESAARELLG